MFLLKHKIKTSSISIEFSFSIHNLAAHSRGLPSPFALAQKDQNATATPLAMKVSAFTLFITAATAKAGYYGILWFVWLLLWVKLNLVFPIEMVPLQSRPAEPQYRDDL